MYVQTTFTIIGALAGIAGLIVAMRQFNHAKLVGLRNKVICGEATEEFTDIPEDIWSTIIDLENWKHWVPGNLLYGSLDPQDAYIGKQIFYHSMFDGADSLSNSFVVVRKWEPMRHFAIRYPSGHERTFSLEPIAEGPRKTKVTVKLEIDAEMALSESKAVVASSVFRRLVDQIIGRNPVDLVEEWANQACYTEVANNFLSHLRAHLESERKNGTR